MGFKSNNTLKRQLETWHGRAYGGTARANTLEKASKGGPTVAHGRAYGGTSHAKLLSLTIGLKHC